MKKTSILMLTLFYLLAAGPLHAAQKPPRVEELQSEMEVLQEKVDALSDQVESGRSGFIKLLLAGTVATDFSKRQGEPAAGGALYRPHFYFLFRDKLLWEGNVDFHLVQRKNVLADAFGDDAPTTSVSMLFNDLMILANDYLTIDIGQFMTPFNFFEERLHTFWVVKTPHKPLANAVATGLVSESTLGIALRGVIPVGEKKFTYAAWMGNGPTLDDGRLNAKDAGRLRWNNFTDLDNSLSAGVQAGFFPMHDLEIGGAFQWNKVNTIEIAGLAGVHGEMIDAHLTYTPSVPALYGSFNVYTEMVRSHVSRAKFSGIGTFNNTRWGTYAQISYRPLLVKNRFIKKLEWVGRYDRLITARGTPQPETQQITQEINYLIMPNIILKNAYVLTREDGSRAQNGYLGQLAVGF